MMGDGGGFVKRIVGTPPTMPAMPNNASTYGVYDPTTQLCPRCGGYGWNHQSNGRETAKYTCMTCEGIGSVGGDLVEVRKTGAGGSSQKLLELAKQKKLKPSEGRA